MTAVAQPAGPAVDATDATGDPAGPPARVLVPPLGPVPRIKAPATAERVLSTGLRVGAVRRPGVPLVEIRLRVPFFGNGASHPARSLLLGETMLTGTEHHDQVGLAAAFQSLGGDLSVAVDSERLLVGGAVLRTGLAGLLDLLAEVLRSARYPVREVAGERSRLIERLSMARSQPSVLAREALRHRLFGDHPYARELPEVGAVAAVTPAQLRRLHADRVSPGEAIVVVVGDLTPGRALDTVEAALGGWDTGGSPRAPRPLPAIQPGPTVVVDRAGSVQSSIRLGGPALPRDDPDYPALQLANLVFGGYFSSRLVENIREDKGYTYGAHSRVEHGACGSVLALDADVATEVTAPALLETWYELGKIATLPVTEEELANVRQYATGTLSMSIATQAGLASTLSALAGVGLGLDWLREHPGRLAGVTRDDVFAVARRFLAPSGFVTVVLGDAEQIGAPVATLGPVEVVEAEPVDDQ